MAAVYHNTAALKSWRCKREGGEGRGRGRKKEEPGCGMASSLHLKCSANNQIFHYWSTYQSFTLTWILAVKPLLHLKTWIHLSYLKAIDSKSSNISFKASTSYFQWMRFSLYCKLCMYVSTNKNIRIIIQIRGKWKTIWRWNEWILRSGINLILLIGVLCLIIAMKHAGYQWHSQLEMSILGNMQMQLMGYKFQDKTVSPHGAMIKTGLLKMERGVKRKRNEGG